jgi:flavin reductase (DIM6/NTAB) family NADH-FMN oxidoreductase RutF
MNLDPKKLSRGARYNLLTGAILPRPIAFVSTVSPEGRQNLAPYSFFTGAGADPMALMFCPTTRDDGSDKDTLRNLLPAHEGGVGDFVVNIGVVDHAREINAAAANLPADESEFTLTGLTPVDIEGVDSPRVAEAPLSFACRTLQVVRLAPGVPTSGVVVIGEVVGVWVDDALVNDRFHVNVAKLAPLARLSGGLYTTVESTFGLPRGVQALDADVPVPVPDRGGPSRS